jgi:hypothetical protein
VKGDKSIDREELNTMQADKQLTHLTACKKENLLILQSSVSASTF